MDDDADLPLSRTPSASDDVRREMEFHLQERAAELQALGVPVERAVADAAALFGDREAVEADCLRIEQRRRRHKRQTFRWHSLRQDLVGGMRLLRKSPLFTAAAILTLAIGVGANAAVFSLLNTVILQPLGYPEADRLVSVTVLTERGPSTMPWATSLEVRAGSAAFAALASYGSSRVTVLGASEPLRATVAPVSVDFFRVFSARAEKGRLPDAGEHAEGANPVAVVSHAFWRDQLGAPASLAGIRLRLSRVHDVIGVMPADFDFPAATQIWTPLELERQAMSHTAHNWNVIGRLSPGFTSATAQREVSLLIERLRTVYAPDFEATAAGVQPLQDVLTADLRTPLYLLFAASFVLLLAACTNLASAQLARGAARMGELAVRSALGASRLRLVRQLLTESIVLALFGAGAGLLVARALLLGFAVSAPAGLRVGDASLDGWVLGFALVVAFATALGFGLFPALRLSSAQTNQVLREGGRGTASRRSMRVWHGLVAFEVALAVMLLAGSQALVRSFAQVMRTDPGFQPEHIATAAVNLPSLPDGDASARVSQFHESVLARLRLVRDVQSAGFVNRLPLEGGGPGGSLEIEGRLHDPRGPFNAVADYRVVGGDYFEAMGIPLLDGRTLTAGDDASAPRVVVVDETFAREQWPGQSALGRRLRPFGMDGIEEPWFTVVGVVGSVRASSLVAPPRATYYFDHRQRPAFRTASVSYAVRARDDAVALRGVLQREIRAAHAEVAVESSTMAGTLSEVVATRRFMMLLLSAFALMALGLAVVGIYSVVAFTAARRTREIGIRLALGASPPDVLRLIVHTAMHGVVPGLIAGGLLAVAGTRTLRSLLYGVSPSDPLGLLLAVGALAVLGVMAAIIPARRATRVDPLTAMRTE